MGAALASLPGRTPLRQGRDHNRSNEVQDNRPGTNSESDGADGSTH